MGIYIIDVLGLEFNSTRMDTDSHGFFIWVISNFGKVYKDFICWFCMVDVRRLFVFVLVGMFLISMLGVVGADAESELEGMGGVDVGDLFSSIAEKGLVWGENNLKFTSAVGSINEYKWLLYAVLLGMIVYTIISSFFKSSHWAIKWGITGAVTLIALLGIPTEIYNSLEVQYGAMGSAILAVIPFIVILFFTLKVGSLLIGRLTWGFFTIYMIVMSLIRFISPKNIASGASWPYLFGIAAGIVMFWWMPFWRKKLFHEELKSQKEIAEKKSAVRTAWKEQQETEAEAEGGFNSV